MLSYPDQSLLRDRYKRMEIGRAVRCDDRAICRLLSKLVGVLT